MESKLWYRTSPQGWLEGLPIGNGRLAAMVYGSEADELALNHEWLWRGENRARTARPVPREKLEEIRELLKQGDYFRAASLANTYYGGLGGTSGLKSQLDAYQPAGTLAFRLDGEQTYLGRSLDLNTGLCVTEREQAGAVMRMTAFADLASQLIVVHWESGRPFRGTLTYSRPADQGADETCEYSAAGIAYRCSFAKGIAFASQISCISDGVAVPSADSLRIQDATQLTAFINIAVERGNGWEELERFPRPAESWDQIRDGYTARFSAYMRRFSLEVALPENDRPTDERIQAVRDGKSDPGLVLLWFNYGRYLLTASSICGELPANLQGKWNGEIHPPWNSDYHLDINLQMNYWAAEQLNMSESVEALLKYLDRFIPQGREAAEALYGCRGIWLPLQADAWGRATPESFGWAVWVGAAPWMAQHYWNHYRYSGDLTFLRQRAYPFFKETARFYDDYLVRDEAGVYQISPSQSPENRFEGTGEFPVSICISSAMDVQLAYDALGYAVRASELLDLDPEDRERWREIRGHLPAFQTGRDGRLLEWNEAYTEMEPGHRHLSHLYGLYPSDLFNPEERKQAYEAAEKSLEYRLSQGGGHTGWSRAWVACLYARLGSGNAMYAHISEMIREFSTVSLLDLHPPKIFQIDGNLGMAAAVMEGIGQYWNEKLHLLRALPDAWSEGAVKGMKVPGGHTAEIWWKDGKVRKLRVRMGYARQLTVALPEEIVLKGEPGEWIERVF